MVYTKDNGDKVDALMKKFGEYCGVDFTYVFDNCYIYTEISLGTHAIDFRNFVELETGFYITDSDWINTGVFTWEKLVGHLNKSGEEGILASFKINANGSLDIREGMSPEKLINYICDYTDATKPYNPVKNISIEKYYRCSKGSPSRCDQFYSGNGILFMSESYCGKYYYWEDYNSNNELIFFRGEKSWVEDNYQKVGLWDQVITPVKDGVTEERKVVDLGEFTLTGERVLYSPNVSENVGTDIDKIKDRWGDNRIGCVDNQLIKTSDVERFEKRMTDYIEDNNLNISVQELVCSGTIKGDMIKSKKELDPSPIKSDGGKSDYYKIELPQWLLDKHSEKGFIMLEDLAEIMFENDFNFTNVFKAQKRMFELTKGQGKAGNDFEYDATKVKYYTDKQVEVFNRNKK